MCFIWFNLYEGRADKLVYGRKYHQKRSLGRKDFLGRGTFWDKNIS